MRLHHAIYPFSLYLCIVLELENVIMGMLRMLENVIMGMLSMLENVIIRVFCVFENVIRTIVVHY